MRIKTSSFCGLSRHQEWQDWLRVSAADLLTSLEQTIQSRKGCKANSEKMMDIYHEVYKRGLGKPFEEFIQTRFPWLIEDSTVKAPIPEIRTKIRDSKATRAVFSPPTDVSILNKHKVFTDYRPNLLGFPQKLIITGNPAELLDRVQAFARDKVGVDYIIIEDRAYIEFFDPKYSTIVDKIKRENRDIYKFRQRQRQSAQPGNINRQSK